MSLRAHALDTRANAEKELHKCQEALREAEDEADSLSKDFGGLTLKHVGLLGQYLQQLPEVMTEKGGKNQTVLGVVEGMVTQHLLLTQRVQAIASEPTDEDCAAVLKLLKPSIRDYWKESNFFAKALGPLTERVDRDVRALQSVDTDVPAPCALPPSPATPTPPVQLPPAKRARSMAEDDDLEF